MSKPILVVVKDPGGTNALLPVVAALREQGCEVVLLADGNAATRAQEIGARVLTITQIVEQYPDPALLVTSTCSGGGLGRELIPLFRGRCETIAFQDFWGARMNTDWKDPMYRPHRLFVPDDEGVAIAQRLWPDFGPERIQTTGFTAMDRLHEIRNGEAAWAIRDRLDMPDPIWPVVLFAGQLRGTSTFLKEVVDAVNAAERKVYFIFRAHPRLERDAPEEAALCEEVLKTLTAGRVIRNSHEHYPSSDVLIAGSDVTLARSSTTLVEAAYLLRPAIAVLFPETGLASLVESTQGALTDFPLTRLGCTATASSHAQLRGLLRRVYDGTLARELRPNQIKHCKNDGKRASNAALRLQLIAQG